FFYTIKNSFLVESSNSQSSNTFGFSNFSNLFNDSLFIDSTKNSFYILLICLPIIMIFTLLFALLINSLKSNRLKSFIGTTLFSQFFISSFAVGLCFFFLFDGDKKIINSIFNIDVKWLNDTSGKTSLVTLSIFLIWRLSSFNIVMIFLALSKCSKNETILMQIDSLKYKDRFIYVFYPLIKKTLLLLFYINAIECITVFPNFIFHDSNRVNITNSSTIVHYIFWRIDGTFNIQLSSAASIVLFIIINIFILIIYSSGKMINLLNKKRKNYV
ncbi:MAG: sugar ABC transporter permease, partial [Mycoplasmatales bacterium]|nr:sugar ABC transporter permease [Mycoplasmatales bacterium]